MEHVKIQEPRRFSRRRQQELSSDMPHWDWFKKVYGEEGSQKVPVESYRPGLQMVAQQSSNAFTGRNVQNSVVGHVESYRPGLQMVAQQFMNVPEVDLDLQQSGIHNSLNVAGVNENVLLQQALSADRNLPFSLQQLKGNVYNSLNVPGADGNVLPMFQQSLSALSADVHNSLKDPGANRNFFLNLQQSINSFKDVFRSSLNNPGANRNAIATLLQSLNVLRGNSHKYLNNPGGNINDLFFLHQLQNVPGMSNNIQTDIRNQHLLKSLFPFHPPKMFPDYNTMEFPNTNGDFRRNVKVPYTNNYAHNNEHRISEQNTIKRQNSANVPLLFFNANNVPNSNPETRLRMFLKLMGQLGEMHKKSIKPVEFDDDVTERRSDNADN